VVQRRTIHLPRQQQSAIRRLELVSQLELHVTLRACRVVPAERKLEPHWRTYLVMQIRNRVSAVAGVVVAILVMATAASAGAATLQPPVIKEVFTPLKCTHAQTTLGMEGCAEQQIISSDKTIDSLNAQIFSGLSTSGKRDFISGNDAWLKYRAAYCLSESDVYQGGTLGGVIYVLCAANINTAHVKELKNFLATLNQN
jgi:uncharacterized protein YecT (DUF1311 family)